MKVWMTGLCAVSLTMGLTGCGPEAVAGGETRTQTEGALIVEEAQSLERAVEEDVQTFEGLLRNGDPNLTVRQLSPEEETAGATIFRRGAALRFWVQPRDYGHDGWQVSVTGDELRIRETYAGVSGTHSEDAAPAQLDRAVRAAYAELDENIQASRAGIYVVEPGDTLETIARDFGLPVERLMELNALATHDVRSGQTLTIPRRP